MRIAEVALWLMDHQMNSQASEVFGQPLDRLPLTSSPHIVQANALRKDWNEILPSNRCSYVMGNPPFIGKQFRDPEQQADLASVWSGVKGAGVLDYVTAWYLIAARYITGAAIPVAFVSTNSISQGEQVGILWSELFQRFHLKIHFAHRAFAWQSESRGSAHVHVVIVGFGSNDKLGKRIFDYEPGLTEPTEMPATNISPYLVEGSDVCIVKRSHPLADVPEIVFGSMPNDGGHLMLTNEERSDLLRDQPAAAPFIRPLLGSEEFINGIPRWCLWLKDAAPSTLRALPLVMARIEGVQRHRRASNRAATKNLAARPTLFGEDRQPSTRYLLIPGVSSESRRHIPMAVCQPDIIANNLVYCLEGADSWMFGVLTSGMHMAWVRTVAGRLKSDFRYSAKLVYNNFPWPNPTPEQKARVETAAQAVLSAREPHLPPRGMSTLADLYDPLAMPIALAKAHAALDKAVEKCYGPEPFQSDRDRVEHLFRLYETLTAPLLPITLGVRGKRVATAPNKRQGKARTPGLPSTDP